MAYVIIYSQRTPIRLVHKKRITPKAMTRATSRWGSFSIIWEWFILDSTFNRKLHMTNIILIIIIAGLSACTTKEIPARNFSWKRIDVAQVNDDIPKDSDKFLQSSKEFCKSQSEKITLPPQTCTASPGRACWGMDYASGACPPQLPEDPTCNTEDVLKALSERNISFISCMHTKGWTIN